eukprot:5906257-Pyramimonas_sp.AAC.1
MLPPGAIAMRPRQKVAHVSFAMVKSTMASACVSRCLRRTWTAWAAPTPAGRSGPRALAAKNSSTWSGRNCAILKSTSFVSKQPADHASN